MESKPGTNRFDVNIKTFNWDPTYMWDFEPEKLTYENAISIHNRKSLELWLSNIKF